MAVASPFAKSRSERGRYYFCSWQNVVFSVWLCEADGPAMLEMGRFSDEVTGAWPTYSSVHIIEASAGIPTKEGRNTLVERARSNTSRLACVAALLPESSVMASLMRAFVRGVRTMTRGKIDIGIEQQAQALAHWLAPRHSERTRVSISEYQLERLIVNARREAAAAR